jgi:nucleotide-binding universal stress UspA family protein
MSTIVVGVDGSDASLRALRFAIGEARIRGSDVKAVGVWHVPSYAYGTGMAPMGIDFPAYAESAQAQLEKSIAESDAPGSEVKVTAVVHQGQAADVLCKEAETADLLVVGARGRGGFRGLLLGSVSQACAHHATCPVVIVPNETTRPAADKHVAGATF